MHTRRTKVKPFKPVFRGTLFVLEQAEATLPSGTRVIFEQARRSPSVTILPIDRDGNLLLIKEFQEHKRRYDLTLPAGKIERGETPRQAAMRELREETGFSAGKLAKLLVAEGTRTLIWPAHVFIATRLRKNPLPKGDGEDITVIPTPLRQAARLAITGKIEPATNCYFVLRLADNQLNLLSQKTKKR